MYYDIRRPTGLMPNQDVVFLEEEYFNVDNIMEIEVKFVLEKGTVTKITLKDKRTIIVVN